MASKAYVSSMTVTELKQELKQRGLSTRGSKKNLRDRLERVRAIFACKHVRRVVGHLFCYVCASCSMLTVLHTLSRV